MDIRLLDQWVPLRLVSAPHGVLVDWMYLGEDRFREPFFEQTAARLLQHPANLLFRHKTEMRLLGEVYQSHRVPAPKGFIFHLSRCGSTLISQMLAANERNHVVSEARPIDQVVRAAVPESMRIDWLRWMLNAFGRARPGTDLFVKFDAWHVLDLRLILQAFPEVPWIFVYRDPVEVMVSQRRERGVQMVPGMLDPVMFGLDPRELWITRLDEYCARVLARLCESALEHHTLGGGMLLNFSELPGAVESQVVPFFGARRSESELALMREAAQFDAKRPGLPFEHDTATKQAEADLEIRELAEKIAGPAYARLEKERVGRRAADRAE